VLRRGNDVQLFLKVCISVRELKASFQSNINTIRVGVKCFFISFRRSQIGR
jgi:hypothetical protein